ncbi:MAG: hypothetical protein HY617_03175, partial [Candidatus Sungbacteria bacterium]|nr:hypothetical protein [Candidatus Sungbacteria bacterium]
IQAANGKGIDLYKMATALLAGIKVQERKIAELSQHITGSPSNTPSLLTLDPGITDTTANLNANLNLQGHNLIDIKKISGYLGKWSIDEEGTLMTVKIITDEIITQKLTVGSASQPNGITLYDEVTKQPYCMKMRNGVMVSETGICGSADNSQLPISNSQSISNDSIINETTATTPIVEETATSTSSEPPVVSEAEPSVVSESGAASEPLPEPAPSPPSEPVLEAGP